MDISSHDVLLVGGGGAGLRAAIAVSEFNPNLSVAVVSKVYPMRSHTVSAEGGAAGVIADDDTLEEHCYDTISGSDWLGDQDAIEAFVRADLGPWPVATEGTVDEVTLGSLILVGVQVA
jgi:fumarate reductase flavoprotein subunit